MGVASFVTALAIAVTVGSRAASADPGSCSNQKDPFALHLAALTAADGTELTLEVAASSPCAPPPSLTKVQLKTFGLDSKLNSVDNVEGVPSPGGVATLALPPLHRKQRLRVEVLVQDDQTVHTVVFSGETTVQLRPDLGVQNVTAPRQALTGRPFHVSFDVAELNGDAGASATATLSSGGVQLAAKAIDVPAGGRLAVTFPVSLATHGEAALEVSISDAVPGESNLANNDGSANVEVTDFEVSRQILVPSLAGYGAQFNQHVYAKISSPPVTPTNVLDLEPKVLALQPQLVRIFYAPTAETTFPDRMASFIRTVELAQRAGATINITWSGGGEDRPELFMNRFANVLTDLVRNHGITNLRWVTIDNEVNSTKVTTAQYEALYRALDAALKTAGLRDQIRFMGGDLVQNNQRAWLDFMAANMADLLDGWSVHIFWDYWDTAKLQQRLADVRAIWDQEPEAGRKPLYAMEYGVRGLRTFNGQPTIDPGVYADGTPLTETNINAFQHAWFTILSSRLGYRGDVKWDSYFGKYDGGTQAYYMIGSPLAGWPLNAVYFATRLLTLTTRRGWEVLRLDGDAGTKLVTSYAGPNGELTVVGLDTAGADQNSASTTVDSYSVGGLPPNATFRLVYWNRDGLGALSSGSDVTTDEAGVAEVDAPLTSMFALTTLDVHA